MSSSYPPPSWVSPHSWVSPPPPPPPPLFVFRGESVSDHSAKIFSVISHLQTNLTPQALHEQLLKSRIPLGIDLNDLGHAYYGYYWKQGSVANQAQQGSKDQIIARIRANQAQLGSKDQIIAQIRANQANKFNEPLQVPNPTAPGDEPHDRVCDVDYGPNYVMSPHVFAEALRTISPKEMMSQYYHHRLICHNNFNDFLTHMNQTLRTYFETPAYEVGSEMNELLNGIIKCICLRVLSSSSYHYAYKANHILNDVAMKHLLEFYQITRLIHPWNEISFMQHVHMIRKYDVLKNFIASVLDLGPSFMSAHYFTFNQVTPNLLLVLVDNLYKETARFSCAKFPQCITDLKRNISSDVILYSMQLQTELNPEAIVHTGFALLQFLAERIKQDTALSRDTKYDYNVAHKVFTMTGEAIQQLPVATHQREHARFIEFEKKIIDMTRVRKSTSELEKVVRMHPSPFQALIISPLMFRAGHNIRASPPPASLRASPTPVHRTMKRLRNYGGARSKKSAKKFTKTRKS